MDSSTQEPTAAPAEAAASSGGPWPDVERGAPSRLIIVAFLVCLLLLLILAGEVVGAGLPAAECGGG